MQLTADVFGIDVAGHIFMKLLGWEQPWLLQWV